MERADTLIQDRRPGHLSRPAHLLYPQPGRSRASTAVRLAVMTLIFAFGVVFTSVLTYILLIRWPPGVP
jgi:hypothetical protein